MAIDQEDRKEKFARQARLVPDRMVLAPIILKHWDRIVENTKEALRYSYGDDATAYFEQYYPLPAVLENVLPAPAIAERAPNALQLWLKVEMQLHDLGLRPECLEFHDCGREALVFRVKGIPEILWKVGKTFKRHDTSFALKPLARQKIPPDDKGTPVEPIYFSAVPNMRGMYMLQREMGVKCHLDQNEDAPEFGPATQAVRLEPVELPIKPVNVAVLQGLLGHEELIMGDPKIGNFRCEPHHPELPMVTDARAVEEGRRNPGNISRQDYEAMESRYRVLQDLLRASRLEDIRARYEEMLPERSRERRPDSPNNLFYIIADIARHAAQSQERGGDNVRRPVISRFP